MTEVNICSFSYKTGEPIANFVLDVRFLPDPRCLEECNPRLTGQSAAVQEYIIKHFDFDAFFSALTNKVVWVMNDLNQRGIHKICLAFGCTAGKHRSVFVAEAVYNWLQERGVQSRLMHRDIGLEGSPTSSMESGFFMSKELLYKCEQEHAGEDGGVVHCTYHPENNCIMECDLQEARRRSVTHCAAPMLNIGLKKLQALRERRATSRELVAENTFSREKMETFHRMWESHPAEGRGPCGETLDAMSGVVVAVEGYDGCLLSRHKSW